MIQDVKYAWRALLRRWQATLTAVACLALAIGVNATLFGVIDALLLRPPAHVVAPDEVMRIRVGASAATRAEAGPAQSYSLVRRISEQLAGVADIAVYAPRVFTLGEGEAAELLPGVIASASYFTVLGIPVQIGRLPHTEENDVPGAAAVAVLSHAAWKNRFDASPGAIGSTLVINGVNVSVIGVAPPGFTGIDLGEPELWLNIGAAQDPAFGGPSQFTDRTFWLQMIARRRPRVSDASLSGALAGENLPRYGSVRLPLHTLPLRAMFFAEQRGENPVPPWTIGITLAVLLLACATVANLLLAQGAARASEMAIRVSLGASRSRILRQLLVENLMIAMAAAVGAVLLAAWSARIVQVLPVPAIPRFIDVRVGVFAFSVAAVATLLFGLLPAVWTTRSDPAALLRSGSTGGSRGRARLQQALMSVQIAVSFVLLVCAGLFLASFRSALRIDTGFELDRVLEVSIDFSGRGFSSSETHQLLAQAAERAAAIQGVTAAATGSIVPFYRFSRGGFTIHDGRPDDEQPRSELVSMAGVDYFDALGIEMSAGRAFERTDLAGSEGVAVVSRAMARRLWPNAAALGSCIRVEENDDGCVRIVGISEDVRFRDLRGEPTSILFLLDSAPDDRPVRRATIFVNTADVNRTAESLRREIQSLHAGMPFVHVRPLDDRVRAVRIQWEVAAALFSAFGALAALLAAVGVYMVIAFMVQLRSRELGIRSALGAPTRAIVTLVLSRAAQVGAIGIGAGAAAAFIVTRLLESRLYGVEPADPVVWAGAGGLLLLITLAASWLPARAAGRLNPLTVLQRE